MSKFVIVGASARAKGTSAMLAELCREFLEGHGCDVSAVSLYQSADIGAAADALLAADTVVISGPSYINTYPAPVIRLLDEWAGRSPRGQKVYGIIQGGMPYMHTHISGLNMLEIFAEKTGLSYNGGFVLGLGALVDGRGVNVLPNGKRVRRQLDIFFSNILDGKPSGSEIYEQARITFPAILARILAFSRNRAIAKNFERMGINAHAPSPYQTDELVPPASAKTVS